MIADDSADMRALIREALEGEFDDIVEAADGRQLIWQLIRSNADPGDAGEPRIVVIADVRMPVYDGVEVLTAWEDGVPQVPVVVITSFPTPELLQRADALGAVFLRKPFNQGELRHAVGEAIAKTKPRARTR